MLISVYEYLSQLQEECAPTSGEAGVRIPDMFASMQVFVFDDAWVEDEFNPFWWEYLVAYRNQRNQPLENNAQRGICDEITERCGSHFSEAARKFMGDVDCRAGAIFTRGRIPAGEFLNQVPGPGGHQFLMLATTKNQKDFNLYAYDPQTRQRTLLADAVARGVIVRDHWV